MEGSGANAGGSATQKPIVDEQTDETGLLASVFSEIFYSPLNLLLVVIIAVLIYKIVRGRFEDLHTPVAPPAPKVSKMKKRDFTVKELKEYDGNQTDGRILMAVNGSVYDVTNGKKFYGPGGPYSAFGGRDASRGLATFNVSAKDSEEYDDLSDLNSVEMGCVKEWEMQLKERYDFVGKLLKPGEKPTNYSDEDEDMSPKSNDEEKVGDIGATTDTAAVETVASTTTTTTITTTTTLSSSTSANETAPNTNTDSDVRKRITTQED